MSHEQACQDKKKTFSERRYGSLECQTENFLKDQWERYGIASLNKTSDLKDVILAISIENFVLERLLSNFSDRLSAIESVLEDLQK